jgi:UDP-glucose 4-epimerase
VIYIKNKKIAVTGGLGFIGSHIVETLCENNEVVVIDNESTGSIENIKHLPLENIDTTLGSINKINLLNTFEGCDYVLHQAALPSVPRSVKDPVKSNHANITGTLKVLVAARDSDVSKVVCASSSSVYGDTPALPKVESMPINPKSPYAVTKATGELYCKTFTEIYNIPTVSLRYFNVFGPRQDPNSQYSAVIPKFIAAILDGQAPIIYGDGTQSRDFTYIKNVVDANILGCKTKDTGVFNVACGRRIILNDLVEILNDILGKEIQPVHTDSRPGDIKHSLADINKIKSIGYNGKDNFRKELEDTVEFFKKNN